MRAAVSVSRSRKRTTTVLPSRLIPAWRMFLSRSRPRMSPVSASAFARQRRLHVHLHQEVHAAAQVQAEVHRHRAQRRQELRRAREQVQRDDVGRVGSVRVQRPAERPGPALLLGVGEARLDRIAVELDEVGLDPGVGEQRFDAGGESGLDLERRLALETCTAGASPKKLGSVVEQADEQRDAMIAYFQGG